LLVEILTEVREELMSDEDLESYGNELNMEADVLESSQSGRNVDCSHVLMVGLSLNPEQILGNYSKNVQNPIYSLNTSKKGYYQWIENRDVELSMKGKIISWKVGNYGISRRVVEEG